MNEHSTIDEQLLQTEPTKKERLRQRNRTAFWIVLCLIMGFSLVSNLLKGDRNPYVILLGLSPFPFLVTIGILRLKVMTLWGFVYNILMTGIFTFSLFIILSISQNSSIQGNTTQAIIGIVMLLILFVWGIIAHTKFKSN